MTTIDISNRFTPEIMNSTAGKTLCYENPNTNIYIHRDDYTVLSRNSMEDYTHISHHKYCPPWSQTYVRTVLATCILYYPRQINIYL